jgi:hypothetical protein
MANGQFTADLIFDVLFRAGEATDGTSQYNARALEYLNRAYLGICAGGGELVPGMREEWRWLKKDPPGVIFVFPLLYPGLYNSPATLTVTFASTSGTFSGPIGENLVSLAGWFIKIGDNPDFYRIATHTINTAAITLDQPWNATSGSYSYITGAMEYSLASDVMRLLSPMRCFRKNTNDDPYKIFEVDLERLEQEYPLADVQPGMPEVFARVNEQTIRFNRYADGYPTGPYNQFFRVEYAYIRRPALLTSPGTSEEPLVPWEWRRVLSDWAVHWLMVDKNEDRAEHVGLSAKSGLEAMAHENQYQIRAYDRSNAFGALRPRQAMIPPRDTMRSLR